MSHQVAGHDSPLQSGANHVSSDSLEGFTNAEVEAAFVQMMTVAFAEAQVDDWMETQFMPQMRRFDREVSQYLEEAMRSTQAGRQSGK